MKKKIIAVLTACALAAGTFVSVTAQGGGDAPITQFLEVSPAREEVSVDKGRSVTREVTITNRHVANIRLKATFQNMISPGEDGETQGTDDPTPWDLKRFASVPSEEFTLAPREARKVTVRINMPADVAPGGYYGLIRFTPSNRTDLPPVAIQGSISTIFLVRVPGPATERGQISDFYATSAGGRKLGPFFIGNDVTFVTKVKNEGNVHFSTQPKLEVNSAFAGKAFAPEPIQSRNVFPTGTRKFEYRWEQAKTGWHTAKVSTSLPGSGNVERSLRVVVVTPVVAVVVLAVLVLLVLLAIIRFGRRRRRRRRANKG